MAPPIRSLSQPLLGSEYRASGNCMPLPSLDRSSSLPCRLGICAGLLLLFAACGGGPSGGSSGDSSGNPSITSVRVSGGAYSQAGYCSAFVATVSGTGNYDHSVQWYVNGVAGGSLSDGYIDGTGDYCSPVQPPPTNPVTIKAIANEDATKSGTFSTRVAGITISPTDTQIFTGATQQFTAVAVGGVSNSVLWQVNGTTGGNASVGTISAAGFYTAPSQLTTNAIQVEATLAEAPNVYAGASVILSAQIVISPQNPQLTYGQTQQFTATINGAPAQVNWAATYGGISASGLYTATATQTPDTIRAWAASASGSTTVQIVGLTPNIVSVSPQPATALDQITINGTNLNPLATVVFSDSIGGQLGAIGVANPAGTDLTVTVPQGAVSGPLFVSTQQGTLAPVQSNIVQFKRLARLRIRSPQRDLSEGESVMLQYALLGDSTPHSVTFSADIGSFSGAAYQAPAIVAADSFAHVTACISGTTSCDTLILGLHPFRIAPDIPLVEIGQSLQLSAILGGSVAGANWSLLTGGGSLSSSGLYQAGTNVISGGPAAVSATGSGATEQTSIGVTGAFPGLLNRINDYFDEHQPDAPGSFADGLAIVGNRMYVAASNHLGGYTDSYFWIDVYDLTDPLQPVWLTAVEANSSAPVFAAGQYLYSYQDVDLAVPGYPNYSHTITIYELQNGIPVLKTRSTTLPQWWSLSNNQGILTVIPLSGSASAGSAEVLIFDLTSGTVTSQDLNILLPPDANNFLPDSAIAVGNRLFVSADTNDLNLGGYILTYDLTTSPPSLLGKVEGRSLAFYTSGNLLFGALGGMDTYDISGQLPQHLSHVDGVNAAQLRGTQLLALTGQQGFRMFDMSNPQAPKQTAVLFDGVIIGYDLSQWSGNYVYEAQGDGGVAIFDATHTGGPVPQYSIYGGPHLSEVAYDLRWLPPYLYAATATFDGAVLSIYDTTVTPINRIGEYEDPNQQGMSVQSAGNYVYFGMTQNMVVLNVSQPTSPFPIASVPIQATSMATAGNTLYAGTSTRSLVVMDITNPAQPVTVAASVLPDVPVRLRVSNNLLLIADGSGGILIYDISSPKTPVLLSQSTAFTAANDVAVNGATAFVAADVDGLGILDISNPAHPVLVSKTPLSTIDPFENINPLNEALSIGIDNGIVYVGTLDDNGLVVGLDCTNLAFPRVVSKFAYGDFVLTAVGSILPVGSQLLIGGALNSGVYPVEVVDISHPFDSIEEFFPPLSLQNPAPIGMAKHAPATPNVRNGPGIIRRFHRNVTDPTDQRRALSGKK